MVRAREYDRDPFDVLDEEIGWDRLVASREEIAALGDLATQDPLSLATQRYAQLRRFAPAFLEAFEFDAPASGQGLQAAVTLLRDLNRTGKRNLPDIVPMPFPSQHWKTVIPHNATPQRRTYETAVVATLRDRLRAGDVWVEGSQDDRRFDAYLVPMDETQRVLGDSTLETDGPAWLTGRRERLHDRLREVRAKLAAGRLEGVRLENSRLKITPYDPLTPPAGERLDRAIDGLMPRIRITDLLWDVNALTGFSVCSSRNLNRLGGCLSPSEPTYVRSDGKHSAAVGYLPVVSVSERDRTERLDDCSFASQDVLGLSQALVDVLHRPILFQVEQPNATEHTTATTPVRATDHLNPRRGGRDVSVCEGFFTTLPPDKQCSIITAAWGELPEEPVAPVRSGEVHRRYGLVRVR